LCLPLGQIRPQGLALRDQHEGACDALAGYAQPVGTDEDYLRRGEASLATHGQDVPARDLEDQRPAFGIHEVTVVFRRMQMFYPAWCQASTNFSSVDARLGVASSRERQHEVRR